jgi:hypothetical protein
LLRRDTPQGYDPAPLVEKLKPYAWARIRLLREKRYQEVLSDDVVAEMAYRPERKSVEEMFGGRMSENQTLPGSGVK